MSFIPCATVKFRTLVRSYGYRIATKLRDAVRHMRDLHARIPEEAAIVRHTSIPLSPQVRYLIMRARVVVSMTTSIGQLKFGASGCRSEYRPDEALYATGCVYTRFVKMAKGEMRLLIDIKALQPKYLPDASIIKSMFKCHMSDVP